MEKKGEGKFYESFAFAFVEICGSSFDELIWWVYRLRNVILLHVYDKHVSLQIHVVFSRLRLIETKRNILYNEKNLLAGLVNDFLAKLLFQIKNKINSQSHHMKKNRFYISSKNTYLQIKFEVINNLNEIYMQ